MTFVRCLASTVLVLITLEIRGARAWLVSPVSPPPLLSSSSFQRKHSLTRISSSQRPDESSQMSNFIRKYLNRSTNNSDETKQDNTLDNSNQQTQTYLIAIPMETCHELAIELESIQRAILYHCPILVHACVPAAALRIPLLQVETTFVQDNAKAVQQLQACINTVLQQPALQEEPWMVSWKGLQGKGVDNSVLYATSDVVSPLVNAFVQNLNQTMRLQAPTWTLSWAEQPEQETQLHLPFLQLPENWQMILQKTYNISSDDDYDDEDNDDNSQRYYALTSDRGGNGISPLFWIEYMEDALGQDLLRLPEIGLYASPGENQAFASWPCLTWPLPVGTNQTILRREREFEGYQKERMQKAEKSLELPTVSDDETMSEDDFAEANDSEEEDIMWSKTRQRLEQLYAQPDSNMDIVNEADRSNDKSASLDDQRSSEIDTSTKSNKAETPQDPAALDGWMREKIQKVISSRARERSLQQLSTKKEKPAIEDNPVFAKFKNGTLVPETPKAPSSSTPALPPYPSHEHVVGFWRMVRSPTGFEPIENANDRSENLILRIDGTTAGGPILDRETQQKASGGTWSLSGDTATSARLLIRLEIPPKKERVLVMEGALERVSMKEQDMPLAPNTFGIPALEQLKSQITVEMEDFLFCGGQVWIEDVSTGRNRDDIGSFSVMKLNLSTDPTQYSITIPRPVRNQD